MTYVLFDDAFIRKQLRPFTFTRPISDIRCGILTIKEKWEKCLNAEIGCLTEAYLSKENKGTSNFIYLNGAVCPDTKLIEAIATLAEGESLVGDGLVLAIRTNQKLDFPIDYKEFTTKKYIYPLVIIRQLPHIYSYNGGQIKVDFELITAERSSEKIVDAFTQVYAPENIFVEAGASIKSAILNAEQGPIYIGKNASIQEGAIIIGPVSLGEGSIVSIGGKIRQNTTLGPYCKVGGEVANSVMFAYSNKAHDGFLGASVIGEWCNLGANCNNSNLKNDYAEVKLYNYASGKLEKTGELFCGLFMGDYTKAGISTMFNTGTVVGVCSNVFGAGFQDKHIPSFTWGGIDTEYLPYRLEKAVEVIRATMLRRNRVLSENDWTILMHIYENKY